MVVVVVAVTVGLRWEKDNGACGYLVDGALPHAVMAVLQRVREVAAEGHGGRKAFPQRQKSPVAPIRSIRDQIVAAPNRSRHSLES